MFRSLKLLKSDKRDMKEVRALLNKSFDEKALEAILIKETEISYTKSVLKPGEKMIFSKDHGYQEGNDFLVPDYDNGEWKDIPDTWKGQLINYNHVLTEIFKIKEQNDQATAELDKEIENTSDEAKIVELKNKKTSLAEHQYELYQYMQYCLGKMLSSNEKFKNKKGQVKKQRLLNLQKSMAWAISENDIQFCTTILGHQKTQSVPLMQAFELNGKSYNLLNYFFRQQGIINLLISAGYSHAMSEAYQKTEMFDLPLEVLNIIDSFNEPAGRFGMLLLFKYTEQKFRELKQALHECGYSSEYNSTGKEVSKELSAAFLSAMKSYCKWRQSMGKKIFANSIYFRDMNKTLLSDFDQCFDFSTTDTLKLERYISNHLSEKMTEFCSKEKINIKIAAELNAKVNLLSEKRVQNEKDLERKKMEEAEIKKQETENNIELYQWTEKRLFRLCKEAALADDKGKPLTGIEKAGLVNEYNDNKIKTTKDLSLYLYNIYDQPSITLAEKLDKILTVLRLAYNSIANRKRHRVFSLYSQETDGIRNLLSTFSDHLKAKEKHVKFNRENCVVLCPKLMDKLKAVENLPKNNIISQTPPPSPRK